MNSGELIRLRQKAANQYISRPRAQDASLVTWRNMVKATSGDLSVPASVPTRGNNANTNVLTFATGHETQGCTSGGYLQVVKGAATGGTYENVLSRAAGCAVCSDPDYSKLPNGVTLPCFTFETRQRYPLTNAAGVVVDSNTFTPNIGSVTGTCLNCKGPLSQAAVDCSCGTTEIYGGGGIATYTANPVNKKLSFPS